MIQDILMRGSFNPFKTTFAFTALVIISLQLLSVVLSADPIALNSLEIISTAGDAVIRLRAYDPNGDKVNCESPSHT